MAFDSCDSRLDGLVTGYDSARLLSVYVPVMRPLTGHVMFYERLGKDGWPGGLPVLTSIL